MPRIIFTTAFIIFAAISLQAVEVKKPVEVKDKSAPVEQKASYTQDKEEPNVSVGIAGVFGVSMPVVLYGSLAFDPGYVYGGGLIFEKMFNSRYGIHTGIYFSESLNLITMNYTGPSTDYIRMGFLNIPVYFLGSYNKSFFSLQGLVGLNFLIPYYGIMYPDSSNPAVSADQMKDLYPFNVGIGVGLIFKFRLARYFDFYFGILSEFYALNLTPKSPNTYFMPYDAKFTLGFMYRTNLFPKKEDWRWR